MLREKIRQLVFASLDKEYERYRSQTIDTLKTKHPKLYAEFLDNESIIANLLATTTYWHGTGRYQYSKQGESKYAGVNHQETFDVLNTIIEAGGLKPHYDPWVGKFTTTTQSLSVANQWAYGKMYAHYHQDETTDLLYEIAPIQFWYKTIMRIQLTENYFKFALGFCIVYTFSNALQKQGKIWLSTFRSDTHKKWPFWEILTTKSDINGNYGILFAAKNCFEPIKLPKILQFLESRTSDPIEFKNINFIAVPYHKVSETKAKFEASNLNTPVLPLEFLELYMRRYSLTEIMTQSYVPK
jgi:hypothetical protein